jgi:gamma-glutamylcyclotransferase (GGCT)/AIG2-like uncharacterized protein YtfP
MMAASRSRVEFEPGDERPEAGPRHLFVYGSLMRRFRNPAAMRLHASSRFIGPATVHGHLYLCGQYPVLRLNDDGPLVHGEVFELRGGARLLAFLDRYEGCSPEDARPHVYERTRTRAALENGQTMDVWIYCLSGMANGLVPISGGRYRPSPVRKRKASGKSPRRVAQSGA